MGSWFKRIQIQWTSVWCSQTSLRCTKFSIEFSIKLEEHIQPKYHCTILILGGVLLIYYEARLLLLTAIRWSGIVPNHIASWQLQYSYASCFFFVIIMTKRQYTLYFTIWHIYYYWFSYTCLDHLTLYHSLHWVQKIMMAREERNKVLARDKLRSRHADKPPCHVPIT